MNSHSNLIQPKVSITGTIQGLENLTESGQATILPKILEEMKAVKAELNRLNTVVSQPHGEFEPREYWDVKKAAEKLSLSPSTIRVMMRAGVLPPPHRFSQNKYLFLASEVCNVIDKIPYATFCEKTEKRGDS